MKKVPMLRPSVDLPYEAVRRLEVHLGDTFYIVKCNDDLVALPEPVREIVLAIHNECGNSYAILAIHNECGNSYAILTDHPFTFTEATDTLNHLLDLSS